MQNLSLQTPFFIKIYTKVTPKNVMRDINDFLPKIPNMTWGAIMNWRLSTAEIKELKRKPPFPEDGKWHSIIQHDKTIHVDNIPIRRRSAESMT